VPISHYLWLKPQGGWRRAFGPAFLTPKGNGFSRLRSLCRYRSQRQDLQPSYYDRRVRDQDEYVSFRRYIWENPVKRELVEEVSAYPYCSANGVYVLDDVSQRLKPFSLHPEMQS
jgi:hypothetical protein